MIFTMFFGIKCYINQSRNNIYKSLFKCLHNITRYKTGKFGSLSRLVADKNEMANFGSDSIVNRNGICDDREQHDD